MKKILLTTTINTLRGKPITIRDEKDKETPTTIRNYLLTLLSLRFSPQNTKEVFWTTEIGILVADEKTKEIELSDDKIKFLIRLVKANKIKQQLPMGGEKEIEIFSPVEQAQLLKALMSEEEIKEELSK